MTPLLVHPHFHRRRTGVTRHVESVVPVLAEAQSAYQAASIGYGLDPMVPRIGGFSLLWRAWKGKVVWHAHRNIEALVGLVLRRIAPRTRVVFTRHSSTPPSRFTRWLLRRVDRRVALTSHMAELLDDGAEIVSHGVDLRIFKPPSNREAAWLELGLSGRYGVGVMGRVRPEKGQGDFVEAVSPLLARHPDWTGVVVGKVKASEAGFVAGLRKRTAGKVRFVPEQSDVLPWYRGFSILVHPSHSEGYSLVHLEALASGCCVVASQLPYVPSLIEHGRTGFLYPPGDVKALSELLSALFRDPGLVAEVGRAAAEAARPTLGLEREAEALLNVYRALE